MLTMPARLLSDAERAQVDRVLESEPIVAAQVAERVEIAGVGARAGARLLGYGRDRIESLCWLGVNLIPVHAGPPAVAAFAEAVGMHPRTCSSLVGEAESVLGLWDRLAGRWGPARDVRPCQPLLATWTPPAQPPDPTVRLARLSEVSALMPAAVAMYTEEVGVSPLDGDGGREFRQRISDLVAAGRMYAKFASGRVVFKAELAVVTRHTAQVQGVWVAPQWRGRGLGTAAMATVIRDALRRVAPSVSLYVNEYNVPALRVYHNCGLERIGTFATVLL